VNIDQERLDRVMALPLREGKHEPPNGDFRACILEAASYIANEPWSDQPQCVCPTIRHFMVSWNDSLPRDEDRDRLLKPLLTKIVGTRSEVPGVVERRAYMALDWLVRVHTPKWLDLNESLKSHAKVLRDLDEIADLAGAIAAGNTVHAARAAARAAAGAAAGAAAWAAAGAAAGGLLRPTTEWLQTSASDLVIRMCELHETQLGHVPMADTTTEVRRLLQWLRTE